MIVDKMKTDAPSNRSSMLAAWLTPALVIGLAFALIPVYFPTNDDSFAQQIFAGSISGQPLPHVTFMGYAWCWLVSKIFTIVPGVPWWTVLHLVTIYISLAVAGLATLRGLDRLGHLMSFWQALILLFMVELGVALPLIGRLQFTTTASLAVAVAVYVAALEALLRVGAASDPTFESQRNVGAAESCFPVSRRVLIWLAPIGLMALGFSYRPTCGYLGLGFWILSLFVVVITARPRRFFADLVPSFLQFACGALIVLMLTGVNAVAYSSPKWTAAFERGEAYSGFTDFPTTPYEENPALYDGVGWDAELYAIASDYWFFLDPRMTTESFHAINEANNWRARELIEHPIDALRERTQEMRQPVSMAYIGVFVCAFGVAIAIAPNHRRRVAVVSIGGTAVVLLGYLFLKGRLPLRAFLSVILPALGVLAACLLVCVGVRRGHRKKAKHFKYAVRALFVALAFLPAAAAVCQFGYASDDYKEQASRQQNIDAFQEYVRERPDKLFIYDYWAELTPQTVWDVDWPANATQWGGWTYIMPWFNDVMRDQGFGGTPTTDTLLRDDVYFVNKDDCTRDLLVADMVSLYGDSIRLEQLDAIGDGLRVYRFILN